MYKIKEYLTSFEVLKKQHKIKETDIDKYQDYKDLFIKISDIGGTGNISEDESYLINDRFYIKNEQAELYYEDNNYLIIIPKTLKAAQFYSNNSQWCTRFPDNFANYTKTGNLYIIIDKYLLNSYNFDRRLQFHFEESQFMDINDIKLKADIKSKFLKIFKDIKFSWKLKYDNTTNFKYDRIRVKLNNKYGLNDITGVEICPINYEYIHNFENGLAKVKINYVYGFINTDGKEIINIKYEYISDFKKNGLAKVKLNGKYGFINTDGKEICDIKYNYVYYFDGGFSNVVLDRKSFYIDKLGNEYSDLPTK